MMVLKDVNLRKRLKQHAAKCSPGQVVEGVRRRISILNWITTYDREAMVTDFIAGVTLGLTIIPQSLAYAPLAGLPSHYGLYAAFMGNTGRF